MPSSRVHPGDDCPLGSGVDRVPGSPSKAMHRRHVDNCAFAPLFHVVNGPLCTEELATNIDIVEQVELLWGYTLESQHLGDTRIVNQNIQPAQKLGCTVDQSETFAHLAQIGFDGGCLATGGPDSPSAPALSAPSLLLA